MFHNTTQALADRVRSFSHPQLRRAEGIKAPSVRTPVSGGYQPCQYALFVMSGRTLSGQISWKAELALELIDHSGSAVGPHSRAVEWTRPRFQLRGIPASVPAFSGRPGSHPYRSGQSYPIDIRPM
jgi:hypothetical protein